jgi:phage terminase small subunit
MALTGKQRAFADAVLAGFSNKEAAIRAGYSEKTASAAGSRLVKDPAVKSHIESHRKSGPGARAAQPPSPPVGGSDDVVFDIPRTEDPIKFLVTIMNEPAADLRYRIDAAKAMLPFKHQKLGEGGKKDAQADAAKKAANKFRTPAAPGLKRVK